MMGETKRDIDLPNGIPINLISRESLEVLQSGERIDFVLNEVKEGKVLILEMGLNAVEEATLIEQTMKEIDHETFIGIEIQSYANSFSRDNGGSWLDRLLKRKKPPRMAVIGPANLLRTIHKDGNVIQTMLITKEQVIDEGLASGIGSLDIDAEIASIEEDLEETEGDKEIEKIDVEAEDDDEIEEELEETEGGDVDSGLIPLDGMMEEYGAVEGGN